MKDDTQASAGEDKGSVDAGAPAKDRKPGEMSLEELAKVAGGAHELSPPAVSSTFVNILAKNQNSIFPGR